jgi:glutathione peroxidase
MKTIFLKSLFIILIPMMTMAQSESFYNFKVKDIDGNEFSFEQLKGKKVMVVNVASKCGFTPQYEGLEELYQQYKDKDFVIIGFPANNFGKQEPGTDAEIKEFCTLNFGVTFPMMSKISVVGPDMDPVYKWLTTKDLNGVSSSEVKWNFQKYLIGEDGKLDKVLYSKTKPDDKEIIDWLQK